MEEKVTPQHRVHGLVDGLSLRTVCVCLPGLL